MLCGETIQLRPVREVDLDLLFTCLTDISNRGDYFPVSIYPEAQLRKRYQENGFWSDDKGFLLILNNAGSIIGHIEFFKPVAYLDGYELSYLIYDPAERNRGAATQAVGLLTQFLFDTKKINRLQLVIHPKNIASQRVAGKNGFVDEGVMRGAWYHRGQYHDVRVFALLRQEYAAQHQHADARLAHP